MSELDEIMDDSNETTTVETEEESKVEDPEPTSDDPVPEPKMVPLAALQSKRQEVRQLKERLEKLEGTQKPKEPDPYEDPEAYKAFLREQWEKERIEEEKARINERIEASREKAIEELPDYMDMEMLFSVLAQKDTELADKLLLSDDPAKFAYEHGKQYLTKLQQKNLKTQIENDTPTAPAPSLASKTAPASSVHVEKDTSFNDMFKDQVY